MQGQGESSGCPVPCCVPCTGERGQEKGARERTGAKEEHAAQRVVYHARSASDLTRRMVGVACAGKRRTTPMGHEGKQQARQASKEKTTMYPARGKVSVVLHTVVLRAQRAVAQREKG